LTGIFEVFIPLYIILKKRGLLQLLRDTKSQLSFGVVFGCTEALIFGISGIVVFASVASLGVDAPASWTHLFSQPNEIYVLNAFYSGLERLLAIIVHVFSMMLIFFFIIRKKIIYLASVVVYKTFIDGITAFFLLSPIIFALEFVEFFFVLIGIISFVILRSMLGKPMAKKRVKKTKKKKSKRRKR